MRIWTGGTFDLLHPGHVALLREAGRLANLPTMRHVTRVVTVAVNSDEFVERYKDARPVQSLEERLTMIEAVRWVTDVQINQGDDQASLILASQADVILIGDDWAPPRDYLGQLGITHQWLIDHDIEIRYFRRVDGRSSTELKERVRA